ncbi:MAG: beta-lactamase [Parcubacteria group bacterium Gr01-1014_70]|nr:MAG: beta-lactamase [Parcubacteria group bacterium Gr01-1014_70]
MKISKYIHSCILWEEGEIKILFDPGLFSFMEGKVRPEDFSGLSAVIITHTHKDHVDIAALQTILERNNAAVLCNADVAHVLGVEGISAEILEDEVRSVGTVSVRAIFAEHENLIVEKPHNTAFLVNSSFLHPGDSLSSALYAHSGVKVLALPITAPWADQTRIAAFAEAMKPQIVVPIHDGYVKDFFRDGQYENYKNYFSEHEIIFQPLKEPGEFVELR